MATEILMPALSPTMTEGTLAKWLKNQGDPIKAGDIIAEIETDKATMEVEAVDEGILAAILVPGGTEGVKVNQVIAILADEGESVEAAAAAKNAPSASPAPVVAAAPAAALPAVAAAPAAPALVGGRVIASPLAKRIAQQNGLDLAGIAGSGPNGRIVKADVEAALAAPRPAAPVAVPAPAPVAAAAPSPAPAVATPAPAGKSAASLAVAGLPDYELQPHTSMRRTIARRLTEAKQSIPHFYLTVDCCLDPLLKLRTDLNARGEKAGVKLSVNDMIIRAAAIALKRLPAANAAWADDGLMLFKSADISVAVAIPGGLITPIIRNADGKALGQISAEMKDLATRAKAGKLKPEEYQGGTFSISNLGMFGIREFAAIINPPQSAILAVGSGEERAVVKNGALAIQTMMTCTLSVDHRVIDGALGAEWLQIFKGLIEDPLSMML